jgi:hypothetical protein
MVIATENDTVYGLDVLTGGIVWQTHLASPAPLSLIHSLGAPCGDIDPLGITSTPVMDAAQGEVFVVAEVAGPNSVSHQLFGLDLVSGQVRLPATTIDPPGLPPFAEQQRAALNLGNGRIYVTYGGLAGDCGPYKGAVVAVTESGSSEVSWVVPTTREGGIWAPSGPSIDGSGTVYVSVGNGAQTDPSGPYDDTDSVVKLSPTLGLVDFFAPVTWANDNANDLDLGSTGPELLAGSEVFQVGKSGVAYLLNASRLGGIGGQVASSQLCTSFGGQAYMPPTVFVSCTDGVRAVQINSSGTGFGVVWQGPNAASGPPVVGGNLVWVMGSDEALYGLNPVTGAVVVRQPLGPTEHFTTPTVADGFVIVAADTTVEAFGHPSWSAWQAQSGPPRGIIGSPAIASWGPGRLDTFVRGGDNALWHAFATPGTGFSGWENLGGQLTSGPAAVAWAFGRVDVVARGTDGGLWHKFWSQTVWSPWESLGGQLTSSPTVASWSPGRLDIFVRGSDLGIWHRWWDQTAWSAWERRSGTCLGDPGATSWGPNDLDVFCIGGSGPSGPVYHQFWRGAGWSPWLQDVPGVWVDGASAASWAPNRIDLFGVDASTPALGHDWWDGVGWHGEVLDGTMGSTPAAVSWGPGRIDVFVLGTDGLLYHKFYG